MGRVVLVLPPLSSTRSNDQAPWDPEIEKYWMPVDLYIGGAEHAVLHLLYSRFWHKVLFDHGLVSTVEPFQRLVNQGMILGETEYTAFQGSDGAWVSASDVKAGQEDGKEVWTTKAGPASPVKLTEDVVVKKGEGFVLAEDQGIRVDSRAHKMSKSRGNVINPDIVVNEYGADSLRLYEMFMGPLEAVKPWNMKGVEGIFRFLARAWRLVVDAEADSIVLDPKVKDVELNQGSRQDRRADRRGRDRRPGGASVQHGDQPPDGVRQRLHLGRGPAQVGDGDVHAPARADGSAPGRGTLGDPRPYLDPGLRSVADLRPGASDRRRG